MDPLFYFTSMTSPAKRHFPQYRFMEGAKWLFNPVLKKRFANRPEERVRLKYVEYLLAEIAFSKNRIGFETPVSLPEAQNPLRADLVLYDREMSPFALIECKSEKIRLNNKTAEQIARYNRKVNAPYLMITNGSQEIWYNLQNHSPEPSETPLKAQDKSVEFPVNPAFWIDRGFISNHSKSKTKQISVRILKNFRGNHGPYSIRYLDIPTTFTSFQLDHYYLIHTLNKDDKIAFTLLNNGRGSTLLSGILNREEKNQGIVCINLDSLTLASQCEATIISSSGTRLVTVPKDFSTHLLANNPPVLKKIAEQLLIFFD